MLTKPPTKKIEKSSNHPVSKTSEKRLAVAPRPTAAEQKFPDERALKLSSTWNAILKKVSSERVTAEHRRHASLRTEIAWTYGLGRYFTVNIESFDQFCALRKIKVKKNPSSSYIMQQVFLEYTGRDDAGSKDASRYKNLVMPSLKEGLSVKELDARIIEVGGVHKLRTKTEEKKDQKHAEAVQNAADIATEEFLITESVAYSCVVNARKTQTLELSHGSSGSSQSTRYVAIILAEPLAGRAYNSMEEMSEQKRLIDAFSKYLKTSAARTYEVDQSDAANGGDAETMEIDDDF